MVGTVSGKGIVAASININTCVTDRFQEGFP